MNITSRKASRNAFGFTLIELMVSLAIAMLVLGGVFQIFVKSSDGNRRLEGLAGVLDNGRFAMSFMQSVIQGAGYIGCRATNVVINNQLATPTGYAWNFTQPITGYDAGGGAWTPALDAFFKPPLLPVGVAAPLAGLPADIITVRGATGPAVNLSANMATPTSAIPVNPNNRFGQGAILLVSDCNGKADVFQKTDVANVTAAHGVASGLKPGNAMAALSTSYTRTSGASVIPMKTSSFYLAAGAAAPGSLWVIQGTAGSELVEGVDGMQILYGVTTNGDTSANQYLTAAKVNAGGLWSNVVSVRIALLLRTVNKVTRKPDTNVYPLLCVIGVNCTDGKHGAKYGPFNDLRLRRIFTTTIALRNRSL